MKYIKNYLLIVLLFCLTNAAFAQSVGVKLTSGETANTTLDVNGAASLREGTALTLVNGTNNDISLATEYSQYRITGPTTAFSITGFSNGVNGRILTVINATTQTMTISGATGSVVANQLLTGGQTFTVAANGSATFQYNITLSKWILTGTSGSASASNNWSLTGNSGTTAGTNFIGTTDAQDLVFRANNSEGFRMLNSNRYVGIGVTTPGQKLEISNGNLLLSNTGTASELRIAEPSASGSNYTAFKVGTQAANITYTLPSADGSSGQVMTTNGSGTMSWATSNGAVRYAIKTATEGVSNSITLQDDDHLTQTLGTNETWEFHLQLTLRGNSNNYKMAIVIPTGATMSLLAYQTQSNIINEVITTSGTGTTSNYQSTTSNDTGVFVSGTITTSSTAGTVKLQWAQVSAQVGATTLGTGSYMKLTKLQ